MQDNMKNERFSNETEEFYEKYPTVDLDDVPKSVWESVKGGKSLSDAYGEHRCRMERIQRQNEENRQRSTGTVTSHNGKRFAYTESDVRNMTRQQIRENYDAIIKSMQSPNFARC